MVDEIRRKSTKTGYVDVLIKTEFIPVPAKLDVIEENDEDY